jgi:hypothetical protein
MCVRQTRNLPARSTTFRVVDGAVAEGRDALLHYCELSDDCGGVYRDLLRTSELGDGWYQFDTVSGITRPLANPPTPQHQHQRKSLRPRGWNTAKRRGAITT